MKAMSKKTYHISGFDCAHCALKSEKHLNKHPQIKEAVIDFAKDRLFVEYEDKELSINELLSSIAEVETDPIVINDLSEKKSSYKIFNKDFWFTLCRVLLGVAIILICCLALEHDQYFYVQLGLYAFGIVLLTYDVFYKVIKHITHKENPIDESLLISLCVSGAFTVAIIAHETHFFMEALMGKLPEDAKVSGEIYEEVKTDDAGYPASSYGKMELDIDFAQGGISIKGYVLVESTMTFKAK